MSLQPLNLPNDPQVRIIGDVQIDPTVAIAPGVILQAAPGCQIFLGRGVCLGMGVIIKAYGGNVHLDEGVSLGPGVLIMGPSHVANNACVGGLSTLWHSDVDALTVLPAGSLLGDPSRCIEPSPASDTTSPLPPSTPLTEDLWSAPEPVKTSFPAQSPITPKRQEPESIPSESPPTPEPAAPKPPGHPTYGKVMLNQLLVTLFPHNIETERSP